MSNPTSNFKAARFLDSFDKKMYERILSKFGATTNWLCHGALIEMQRDIYGFPSSRFSCQFPIPAIISAVGYFRLRISKIGVAHNKSPKPLLRRMKIDFGSATIFRTKGLEAYFMHPRIVSANALRLIFGSGVEFRNAT